MRKMTKTMKKLGMTTLALCLSASLAACSSDSSSTNSSAASGSKEETYLIKVGYTQNENDPLTKGLYKLSENVKQRTNGKLVVEVYPNSQLGDTPDVLEQAKAGANVGLLVDAGRLADYVPEIGVIDAPYLYETYEEGKKLVTSDLFNGWTQQVADKAGIKVASFNWYQGARHMLTNKPIEKPEDLQGLKIRTTGSKVWQATVEAMGAKPTSMAWAEIYSGLQQKVIDGAEAQNAGTYGSKLYETVDYLTKTGHFQLMTGLVVGNDWFNSLPEDYQKIFLEESLNAGDYASEMIISDSSELEEKMKAEGLTINEVDLAPFMQATDKVYDDFPGFRELQKEIRGIIGKN
ncbi:C4-dicarboxylate TRAP transporter substrate-binding protein [Ammoniphilus sp. 3BR4]|uniref:C4-dicarboxylate TRAP transporter substrate-binding protein n=1 Tax=Ammoniphilus sp. 3BR4 TaxID=3158265 RepID=UPI0034667A6B